MPVAWLICRICEEWPAYTPAEAFRAWRTAPVGFFEELIELRAFASVHQLYRSSGGNRAKLPDESPLADLCQAFEFEAAEAELRAHG